MPLFLIATVNVLLMAAAVAVHYETLYLLARNLPQVRVPSRFRVLIGVFGILAAHIVEIWLFAVGYFVLSSVPGMGDLHGSTGVATLLDCAYFSFVTFTTVGYGDLFASGDLRYLTGIEALTGFVLITWSASFLFLEMQRNWNDADRPRD